MVEKDQPRRKYPSDLTDEQWAIVGPLIPPAKQSPRGGRPRKVNRRKVLNTLFNLEPQWLPMGYVAARFAAQEYRLGLLCAVARRWDMGQAGRGLARADSCGCGTQAHAQCRVH